MSRKSRAKPPSPFRYFHPSPDIIRMVAMLHVRYPLPLRKVEVVLFERGIDVCHELVRLRWNRFGPIFATDIRRRQVSRMKSPQKFASIHASFSNHFNQERHLVDRQSFKARRAATLAEWHNLAAW